MTFDDATPRPRVDLQRMIEQHGVLAVGTAFLRVALARRKHPPDLALRGLSPHLRRDLGLPPFGNGRWIR